MGPRALLILLSVFVPADSFSTQCIAVPLGDAFDDSEYVIHGRVIDKNYMTPDIRKPVVTFEVIESFKGNAREQVSFTVSEEHSYEFETGFEYVVFAYRDWLSIEAGWCWPWFQAFPSTVEIARQLVLHDSEARSETVYAFDESLTGQERIQFEKNLDAIQEKRLERLRGMDGTGNLPLLAGIAALAAIPAAAYLVLRRRPCRRGAGPS